ncbi:protein hunchback-like [Pseudomyrmex gracilis]|uniref:protein hunchback-like n=1 Tax=Pseudomyrmex gracilis TaxID=219809 RepID=UPI00099530E5|nr:protein hunchback-like [Pseudomyrmex gracilis]
MLSMPMSSVDTNTSMSTFTVDTSMSIKDQMTCVIAATKLRTIPTTKHIPLEPGILRCPVCSFVTAKRKQFLHHMAHEGCPSQYNQFDYITVMLQLVNHSISDEMSASSSEDEAGNETKDLTKNRKQSGKKTERKKEAHVEMKKCMFCDIQTAKGTQEYYAHLRTHLPEGFVCIKCSFVAQHNHHLLFHWFSAHETYRPFKCSYRDEEKNSNCKYRCISKSMLASHEKVHLQFYQYRCDTCEYKTRHKSSLKKHLESTNHVPQVVLNMDGTPNPDIIIDINSRKRGPRQKKDVKTPSRTAKTLDDSNSLSDYKATTNSQLTDTSSSCASQCGTPDEIMTRWVDTPIPTSNLLEFYKHYSELTPLNSRFYALLYNSGNIINTGYSSGSVRDIANDSSKDADSFDKRDVVERDVAERDVEKCSMISKFLDKAQILLRSNMKNATVTGYSSECNQEISTNKSDNKTDSFDNEHIAEIYSIMPKSPEEVPDDKCVDDINRQVDLIDFNTHTKDVDEPYNLSVRKTIWDESTQLQTRPVVTSLLTNVKTRKDTRKRTESEEMEELNKSVKQKRTRSYEAEIPVFPMTSALEKKNQEDCTISTRDVIKINEHPEMGSRNITNDNSANVINVPENATKSCKTLYSQTYMCNYCELTFRNSIMYDEHMGYHDKTNPLQCHKCREEYLNFVCFFKHIGSRPH